MYTQPEVFVRPPPDELFVRPTAESQIDGTIGTVGMAGNTYMHYVMPIVEDELRTCRIVHRPKHDNIALVPKSSNANRHSY